MKVQVRKGDTLWYYSHLFLVPLNLILNSNPSINPSDLKISQEVKIPGFQIIPYKVRRGDTLWKIAAARNLSVDALLLLNSNINANQLAISETIFIPKRVVAPIVLGKTAYSFESLLKDINDLKKVYPFISIQTIGKSVLGKPLQEIRIGKGKKKVHMNASFHANEWITTPILMQFLNTYLLSLTNGTNMRGLSSVPLYLQTELSIVPMVNPDGVNLVLQGPPIEVRENVMAMNGGSTDFKDWKANIRGVDLNNQYPANWQIEKDRKEAKSPAPRDYPGDAPLTEPEAIAMADLAKSRKFDLVVAFHTQGKEFYWGYENLEPQESQKIAEEYARFSGYQSIRYIDSHAGFKDWFIQDFRKPGFTLELGSGRNPLPLSQFDEIYEHVLGIFLASLYM
ncbi:M14 family metallopeptidase [Bacillus sp. CGMCC 1.16607]|uniref:M14 family metallopeptidase n=1 Tax=Bacillus sp. CGMCC 1.16607 TaxID=3351842 RepID=UPI003636F46F